MASNFIACGLDQHYLTQHQRVTAERPPRTFHPRRHQGDESVGVLRPSPRRRLGAGGVRPQDDDRAAPLQLLPRRTQLAQDRAPLPRGCRLPRDHRKPRPHHTSIARFRQAHEAALNGLFTQALTLCAEAGLVQAGVVALDGTKMEADASLAANCSAEAIHKEVREMLTDAAATDARKDHLFGPDRRGDELPAELADPTSRLTHLKGAKAHQDGYENLIQERKA